MAAHYNITITNMNLKSSGRFKSYKTDNHGKALGIVRCCLKAWGGAAHIVGCNAHGEIVNEHFVSIRGNITKVDPKQFAFYWNMAWDCFDDYQEESRPVVKYNVYNITVVDEPKEGLLRRVTKWIKSKL